MKMFKNFVKFFAIAAYIFAAIGATGYLFYYCQPHFAIANIVLTAMATPKFIQYFKDLM